MNAREEHLAEITRLKRAREQTCSPILKVDYGKRIKRMYEELRAYDRYQKEAKNGK